MSTATTLSRVTGFVRMWATAFALGATGLMSAYSVANNIPNMVFELVAGGILSSLFIPTFMELSAEQGEEDAWRFASHVFNLFVLALGVVALAGIVYPQFFIWTQTFSLPADEAQGVRAAAEFFFRFFAIQVVLYGGGMVMQGLLNAQRRYLWPALGPVFNNVVVIVTMLVFAAMPLGRTSMIVLAAGTTLGVLVMFAVMVPSLARGGIRYSRELGLRDPAVRRMLLLAVPTIVYVLTNLVAVSFRNTSALAVSNNGPSILMYAWTFYQLPYGILAVALATAVFTELADAAGRQDIAELKAHFGRGLRATGVLMLPAAAMLIALAEPLVSLYRVGAFRASDVPEVATALRLWAAGLIFFACMMFVLRTFYSLKDTRTPMLANLALTPVQIGLYVLLSTGSCRMERAGHQRHPHRRRRLLRTSSRHSAAAAAPSDRRLRSARRRLDVRPDARGECGGRRRGVGRCHACSRPRCHSFGPALVQVAAGGAAGLAVAFGTGRLLRVREVSMATEMVRRALGRRKTGCIRGLLMDIAVLIPAHNEAEAIAEHRCEQRARSPA